MAKRTSILRERMTALIGIALLFTLVAASYYYSVQLQLAGLRYVPSENSPDFKAQNVTLTDFTAEGAALRRLSAQTLAHYSNARMNATGAQYRSMNPDRPQVSLKSDKAWSLDSLKTIELSGNVSLHRDPDKTEPALLFQTSYLKGYLDTFRFETNQPVFMRRGIDTTKAERGMNYDNVAHTISLFGGVQTTLHPNASKKRQ